MSTCIHSPTNTLSHYYFIVHILLFLFHWHLEYFGLCICQVQDEQQITTHCSITAFKASSCVFILHSIRGIYNRNSAIQYSINALVGSLYCHHFLLLQLTSSCCCCCPIHFHKAMQTGQSLIQGVQQSLWTLVAPPIPPNAAVLPLAHRWGCGCCAGFYSP